MWNAAPHATAILDLLSVKLFFLVRPGGTPKMDIRGHGFNMILKALFND